MMTDSTFDDTTIDGDATTSNLDHSNDLDPEVRTRSHTDRERERERRTEIDPHLTYMSMPIHATPTCSVIFSDFEHVLSLVGGFGRYQILVMIAFQLIILQMCGTWVLMSLALVKPTSITCVVADDVFGNGTMNGTATVLTWRHNDTKEFCEVFDAGGCEQGLHFESYFVSLIEEWHLICGHDWVVDFMNTMQTMTTWISIVGAVLADKIGRRRVVLVALAVLVVSNLAGMFATNWTMFMLTRLVAGIAFPTCNVVFTVWAMESIDCKNIVIMNLSSGWHLMYVVLGITASWVQNWRGYLGFLCCVGIPYCFILAWFVESPRWMIQRGRLNEHGETVNPITPLAVYQAAMALNKMARVNGQRAGRIHMSNLAHIPQSKQRSKSPLEFTQLLINRRLACNVVLVQVLAFAAGYIASAYLSQIGEYSGPPWNAYIYYGLLRLTIVPVIYFGDKYFPWFGRRHMGIFALTFIASAYGLCTFVLMSSRSPWTDTLEFWTMLLSAVTCNFLWIVCTQYQVELFPTYLRNSALAVTSALDPMSNIAVNQIVYLEKFWRAALAQTGLVFSACTTLLAVLAFPETKGVPLPDAPPEAGELKFVKKIVGKLEKCCTRAEALCYKAETANLLDNEEPISNTMVNTNAHSTQPTLHMHLSDEEF